MAGLALPNGTEAHQAPDADRKVSVAGLKADFAQLYETLEKSHYDLFARRSRAEYDALFRSMLAGLDRPLRVREAHARFQAFAAYGRVAHSRTQGFMDGYAAYLAAGGKALPLRFRVVDGNAYVVEPGGDPRIDPGDQLLSLDGESIKTWVGRLGAYVAADNDYMMQTLMEFDFPGLLWLRSGTREAFAARVRSGEKVFDTVVQARSREDMRLSDDTLHLDWNKREWRMTGDGTAYLRPGPFYDTAPGSKNIWDVRSFVEFVDGAFTDIVAAGARAVVIDLRNNAGGDNSFSDVMLSWFADRPYRFVSAFRIRVSEAAIVANQKRLRASQAPDATSPKLAAAYRGRKPGEVIEFETPFACPRKGKRFAGEVLLLLNRHSYSNTVMVAALAQDFGFATIVGEETSDLSTTYGAMEQFELAHTRIAVGFPKAYIVRPSGATDPRGVVPDVAIATPIVETKDDPVLQQALRLAAEGSSERRSNRRPSLSAKIAQDLARTSPCRD